MFFFCIIYIKRVWFLFTLEVKKNYVLFILYIIYGLNPFPYWLKIIWRIIYGFLQITIRMRCYKQQICLTTKGGYNYGEKKATMGKRRLQLAHALRMKRLEKVWADKNNYLKWVATNIVTLNYASNFDNYFFRKLPYIFFLTKLESCFYMFTFHPSIYLIV